MFNKHSAFTTAGLLLSWCTFPNFAQLPNISLPRWSHTLTLHENKLYVVGGYSGILAKDATFNPTLLSLDISKSFNLSNPPFEILDRNSPLVAQHVAGPVDKGLVVYGGTYSTDAFNNNNRSSLYFYDFAKQTWSAGDDYPKPQRYKASLAYASGGKSDLFLFGGRADNSSAPSIGDEIRTFQEFYRLGRSDSKFQLVQSLGKHPTERYQHGSVMLKNGDVLVFGGALGDGELALMKEIYVYSGTTGIWTLNIASGFVPADRRDFVAIGNFALSNKLTICSTQRSCHCIWWN